MQPHCTQSQFGASNNRALLEAGIGSTKLGSQGTAGQEQRQERQGWRKIFRLLSKFSMHTLPHSYNLLIPFWKHQSVGLKHSSLGLKSTALWSSLLPYALNTPSHFSLITSVISRSVGGEPKYLKVWKREEYLLSCCQQIKRGKAKDYLFCTPPTSVNSLH